PRAVTRICARTTPRRWRPPYRCLRSRALTSMHRGLACVTEQAKKLGPRRRLLYAGVFVANDERRRGSLKHGPRIIAAGLAVQFIGGVLQPFRFRVHAALTSLSAAQRQARLCVRSADLGDRVATRR